MDCDNLKFRTRLSSIFILQEMNNEHLSHTTEKASGTSESSAL